MEYKRTDIFFFPEEFFYALTNVI